MPHLLFDVIEYIAMPFCITPLLYHKEREKSNVFILINMKKKRPTPQACRLYAERLAIIRPPCASPSADARFHPPSPCARDTRTTVSARVFQSPGRARVWICRIFRAGRRAQRPFCPCSRWQRAGHRSDPPRPPVPACVRRTT